MSEVKTRKKQGKTENRGSNPNSRANLEKGRWKAGESGNPAGPKAGYKQRGTILKELLDTLSDFQNPISKAKEKMEVEKAMDLALVGKALKGDVSAWREVKDSVYGKMVDKNEMKLEGQMDVVNMTAEEYKQLAQERLKEAEKTLEKFDE